MTQNWRRSDALSASNHQTRFRSLVADNAVEVYSVVSVEFHHLAMHTLYNALRIQVDLRWCLGLGGYNASCPADNFTGSTGCAVVNMYKLIHDVPRSTTEMKHRTQLCENRNSVSCLPQLCTWHLKAHNKNKQNSNAACFHKPTHAGCSGRPWAA